MAKRVYGFSVRGVKKGRKGTMVRAIEGATRLSLKLPGEEVVVAQVEPFYMLLWTIQDGRPFEVPPVMARVSEIFREAAEVLAC